MKVRHSSGGGGGGVLPSLVYFYVAVQYLASMSGVMVVRASPTPQLPDLQLDPQKPTQIEIPDAEAPEDDFTPFNPPASPSPPSSPDDDDWTPLNPPSSPSSPSYSSPGRRVGLSLPRRGAGGEELAPPPAGLRLKAITIAVGEQQWGCSAQKSVAYGAAAELYDLTDVYPAALAGELNEFVGQALRAPYPLQLRKVGRHYFDRLGQPTFDLGNAGFFQGVRTDAVAPPRDADPGLNGQGAIPWLQLTDRGASRGYRMVYRVMTAGGQAPTSCSVGRPLQLIKYAALYYFYG